jgi:hypothetical protein
LLGIEVRFRRFCRCGEQHKTLGQVVISAEPRAARRQKLARSRYSSALIATPVSLRLPVGTNHRSGRTGNPSRIAHLTSGHCKIQNRPLGAEIGHHPQPGAALSRLLSALPACADGPRYPHVRQHLLGQLANRSNVIGQAGRHRRRSDDVVVG